MRRVHRVSPRGPVPAVDWHCGLITASTPVNEEYRSTQNVRRFLRASCGSRFTFDRELMQWITDGKSKTMGEVAQEWLRRRERGGG